MKGSKAMREFEFTVKDELGVHARPAGKLVKTAGKFSSSVMITNGERKGDAKRIFSVMSLGIRCGDTVTVTVEGKDEETAADELEAFLKKNL